MIMLKLQDRLEGAINKRGIFTGYFKILKE